MKTIYKYPLKITNVQQIEIPQGFNVLHVGLDPQDQPCIWAAVDTTKETQMAQIVVLGTGHNANGIEWMNHLGSFRQDCFMWHVFLY